MTKVQRHFQLQRPVDDVLMERLAQINAIYGIEQVRLRPNGNLMVEYDATRMSRPEVEGIIERAGIPVAEIVSA